MVKIPYRDLIIDARYSVYVLVDLNKFKLKARGVKKKTNGRRKLEDLLDIYTYLYYSLIKHI